MQTFQGHTETVMSVARSGDGKLVATGSDDKTAILWEAASGKKLQTIPGRHWITSVALSGDGQQTACLRRAGAGLARPEPGYGAGDVCPTTAWTCRTGWGEAEDKSCDDFPAPQGAAATLVGAAEPTAAIFGRR
jgi:WD40 domain-containing protein